MSLTRKMNTVAAIVGFGVSFAASAAAEFPRIDPRALAFAEAAARAPDVIADFYAAHGHASIWFGDEAAPRRMALLQALEAATGHGLPDARAEANALRARFATADRPSERRAAELEATERLLRHMQATATGVIDPSKADATIVLEKPDRDWAAELAAFVDDPQATLRSLRPQTRGYDRLLREKRRLEAVRRGGGWGGPVPPGDVLRSGDGGARVVALRDRLVAMGYLRRSASASFDPAMAAAVQAFQGDHGLRPDGNAGAATLAAINVPVGDRLAQVVMNLERRRWLNRPMEPRHILVNIAEQRAYVVDDGVATFGTDVVVGKPAMDRRTPEFSDTMTHMVINPTWYVPRSIAVNEYLPALQRGRARHLQVFSSRGRVNPDAVDFRQYTKRTFPFSLRQPPGPSNALGKVKFLFPNRHNIYLHDTPSKSLFSEDVRTFSHGCVRVSEPFELAYHLLAPQEADPRGAFHSILDTGRERQVDLDAPVGVHLVYWSAWVSPEGRVNYRGDPYGRDDAVKAALRAAGVDLGEGPVPVDVSAARLDANAPPG